ncbi:MAG: response regulator [Isosphaeraceae bacterium]
MNEILIVDDEFDLTSTIKAILRNHGYRVDSCSTGQEALDCIRAKRPDLVLLDVMIPLGSGYDVLDRLRLLPEFADLPVILMNSVPPPAGRPVTWQAFLKKPLSVGNLLATVDGLLGPVARQNTARP